MLVEIRELYLLWKHKTIFALKEIGKVAYVAFEQVEFTLKLVLVFVLKLVIVFQLMLVVVSLQKLVPN